MRVAQFVARVRVLLQVKDKPVKSAWVHVDATY